MTILKPLLRSLRARLAARPIVFVAVATFALSLFFIVFPAVDLAFTRLFYVAGEGFPAARIGLLQELREAGSNIPVAVAIVLIVVLVLKLIYPLRPCLLPPRFTLYMTSVYLLGPVLLVNGILKTFWGRPRPVKTLDFGGSLPFVDAWSIGDKLFSNRSFVSGEAAAVACLLPLVLFVPRPWRWQVVFIVALMVGGVSLNRIAFGAHYLSDVAISIALVVTVAVASRQLFYVSHAAALSNEVLEARLTRIGLNSQAAFRRLVDGGRGVAGSVGRLGAQQVPVLLSLAGALAGRLEATLNGIAAPLSSAIGGTMVRFLSQVTPNRS